MSVFISNLAISPEFGYLDGKLYAFINKKLMVMGFSVTIILLAVASVYTLLTSSLNGNAAYKIYSVCSTVRGATFSPMTWDWGSLCLGFGPKNK